MLLSWSWLGEKKKVKTLNLKRRELKISSYATKITSRVFSWSWVPNRSLRKVWKRRFRKEQFGCGLRGKMDVAAARNCCFWKCNQHESTENAIRCWPSFMLEFHKASTHCSKACAFFFFIFSKRYVAVPNTYNVHKWNRPVRERQCSWEELFGV